MTIDYDIAIIGGGGAGLTAAIYASRARRRTAIFERKMPGGQIATTAGVENYPGFPDGVEGPDLAQLMLEQAEKFGAQLTWSEVTAIEHRDDQTFVLTTDDGPVTARAVIVTAGADYNHLEVPGEEELVGRGVSYCATCDAAFFQGQEVVVVGGGDAAFDEALFSSRYASKVTLVHRRDEYRASAVLQERAFANPKFNFITDTVVESIEATAAPEGYDIVGSVRLRNVKTDEQSELATSAVFIFIGQTPNSHILKDLVDLDPGGHAIVDLQMQSSIPGLFVAGDIRTGAARQLVSACGDGATAAIAAEAYLNTLGLPEG